MKKFTWNDLATAINQLPEQERSKQVFIAIGDESKFRTPEELTLIPEDVWVNINDEDDCGPIRELKDIHGDEFVETNYRLATSQGTPFLSDSN